MKIEEKIVCDANTLENVGRFGIKKALYVGELKKKEISKKHLNIFRRILRE